MSYISEFVFSVVLFFAFLGNIDPTEAESMIQHIEDVLFKGPNPICHPIFPSQHMTNRVVRLERGTNYFYSAQGLNPSDDNSALVHYIQVLIYTSPFGGNKGSS